MLRNAMRLLVGSSGLRRTVHGDAVTALSTEGYLIWTRRTSSLNKVCSLTRGAHLVGLGPRRGLGRRGRQRRRRWYRSRHRSRRDPRWCSRYGRMPGSKKGCSRGVRRAPGGHRRGPRRPEAQRGTGCRRRLQRRLRLDAVMREARLHWKHHRRGWRRPALLRARRGGHLHRSCETYRTACDWESRRLRCGLRLRRRPPGRRHLAMHGLRGERRRQRRDYWDARRRRQRLRRPDRRAGRRDRLPGRMRQRRRAQSGDRRVAPRKAGCLQRAVVARTPAGCRRVLLGWHAPGACAQNPGSIRNQV